MKKSILAIALMSTFSYANAADVDNTWYIGAGAGQSNYESVDAVSHLGDDSDLAWNAIVGYQLNKYFAVEAGWQDLGTDDDTHQWGGLDGSQSIKVDGFTLGLVGTLPLNEKWFLTGEAGAYQYHLAHQVSADKYVSATDTAPYFGAGVGYKITDSLEVSAKYRRFAFVDENAWNTANMDAQTVGLQMVYRFGVKPAHVAPAILPAVIPVVVEEAIITHVPEIVYATEVQQSSVAVLFGFDSAKLSSKAETKLDEVIRVSKLNDNDVIMLDGQSDNQGPAAYNQKLSEARVQQVKDYLTTHGVEVQKLETKATGSKGAQGNTLADRVLERRVTITLTSEVQVVAS